MIIGIDPGIDGAAAALDGDGRFYDVIDLPTIVINKRREIDAEALWKWIRPLQPTRSIIEHVHSMPRDGRVGSFYFGKTVGSLQAVCTLAAGSVEWVAPVTWKSYFKLICEDKAASRGLALRLWPDQEHVLTRVKDHNRAEAMLIAWWAVRPPIGKNW